MKKANLLLLLSFVLAVTNVSADMVSIPPPKMQVQLTNLTEFPDVVIVEFDEGAVPADKYRIMKGNRLTMSPVTGRFVLFYVMKKEYLEKVGLDNIKWENDKNVQRLNVETGSAHVSIDLSSATYTTKNQFSAIYVDLKLAKKNNTYYVYKSKVAGKLRTNSSQQAPPDIVRIYKDEVVDPVAPILISGNIL